jgi:hypothetical protein
VILLVAEPPPALLEGEVRVQEENKLVRYLEHRAEALRANAGLTVRTGFTEGDPAVYIEGLSVVYPHLLVVTAHLLPEHKVMRFLHQGNAPVLIVAVGGETYG